MKKTMKFLSLIFCVALCMMLFASCGAGGFESVAKDILKKANETNSFDNSYNYKCIGTIDGTAVELSGSYWRQQSEESGNIYDDVSNRANIGEIWGREYLTLCFNDGQYYFTEDETFTCSTPIVSPEPTPGRNFWPIFLETERISENEDALSCTIVLSGEQLRETIKEYCPRIYNDIAPFADWNSISAEIFVDLNEIGYVEQMEISCPDIGEVMIQAVNSDAEVKCTDFDITVYCTYGEHGILEPDDKAIATEGTAPEVYGMVSLMKYLLGENEEAEEIIEENEAAENFEPVTITEGSVNLSCNGVNVSVAIPSGIEIYGGSINHIEAGYAIVSHDILSGDSGRTIVQLTRGTTDSFFSSLGLSSSAAQDIVVNGISGKLITQTSTTVNTFGTEVISENYFFAADLGGTVLGVRLEACCSVSNHGAAYDTLFTDFMNYITIS